MQKNVRTALKVSKNIQRAQRDEKVKHVIPLNLSVKPVFEPIRKRPFKIEKVKRSVMQNVTKLRVLEASVSPHAIKAFLQKKKEDTHVSSDFKRLNHLTAKNPYPIENSKDGLAYSACKQINSVFEFKQANQLCL